MRAPSHVHLLSVWWSLLNEEAAGMATERVLVCLLNSA
jgi:hypothetical protein